MSIIKLINLKKDNIFLKESEILFSNNSRMAVVGKNGKGKTTFLRLLSGLCEPDQGEIYFDEKKYSFPLGVLKKFELNKVCRTLFFYTEGSQFLYTNLSIEENIDYYASVGNINKNEVYKNLKNLNFDEPKEKRCGSLSLGTCQKITAAFCLSTNKPFIVCDEPTLGMDVNSKNSFFEELTRQNKGIIISTNDTTILKHFDTFIICEEEGISVSHDYSIAESRM